MDGWSGMTGKAIHNPGFTEENGLEGEMIRNSRVFWATVFVAFLGLEGWAGAQHQHGHGASPAPAGKTPATMKAPASKTGVQSVVIEGFRITFEVMSMEEHMKHLKATQAHGEGDHMKTHSLMVMVQDTISKEIISDARVRYTIISPAGRKETGNLTWSGDHYGGGFSPKEKGSYQVQIRIESGGMEKEAKFTYQK